MRLVEAFRLDVNRRIAFVGAGGKTTAMFRLAEQARQQGYTQVLVTATTHLAVEQTSWGDTHTILNKMGELNVWQGGPGVHVFTGPLVEEGRVAGLGPALIDAVAALAEKLDAPLLIEADGSRRLPLKAPAAHEPVIPPWVDEVVVAAGMSGVGLSLGDAYIHRAERFASLSGLAEGEAVTIEGLANVLLAAEGGLKGIPARVQRSVLLNQCDTDVLAGQAAQLARMLLPEYEQVISARLQDEGEGEVLAVHRRVAGVVLAAGGSARMGQPKQLLDWFGKPFVRVAAETALKARLWPVLVVAGAEFEQVRGVVSDLPVKVVQNEDWAAGQSTSVRAAMSDLTGTEGPPLAAMFLLADQPQVPVELVSALLETYATTLSPVVAPLVNDRRGNPVLFDWGTFEALAGTVGDAGGRQVFSRFRVLYIPWLDDGVGLDVDTREDYAALIAYYTPGEGSDTDSPA